MTGEQYNDLVRRIERLEHHSHNTSPPISVGRPVYNEKVAADDPWGRCQHCGCCTAERRDVCSDCY